MKAAAAQRALKVYASPARKATNEWFFKTGKGEYGYGDKFIGVTVPNCRKVAKEYRDLSLAEVKKLLYSKVHEERLMVLFILVGQFEKGDSENRARIYKFYLKHKGQVNNWDLVDSSAHKIVGAYLLDQPKKEQAVLDKLALSKSLWDRRIAIIATLAFIGKGSFDLTLKLSKKLLNDKEDLMHKAVGWMLREVGKKDTPVLESFLAKHYEEMPRTMLRYAIEKFPEHHRKQYLRGEI